MAKSAKSAMPRRDFLATGIGLAAAPLFLPSSGVFAAPRKPDMVVVRGGGDLTPEEASYRRLKKGVDRLGGLAALIKGKNVLIKVNATERTSQDGNTSPAATIALLRLCRECAPADITVVGHEWGGYDSIRAGQPTLRQVIKKDGAGLIELPHYWTKGSEGAYKLTKPEGDVWSELWVAKGLFEPDTVVLNLARLKTHPHCVFTGCVKNVIGLTRNMYGFHKKDDKQWPKNHGNPAGCDGWPVFARKLAHAFRDVIGPQIALHILDAGQPTFGWRGPAPERIHTFDAHTTIVGTDALAMDVYGCGMLKAQRPDIYVDPLGPWNQGDSPYVTQNKPQLNYLVECGRIGVGETNLAKVNIDEFTIG
ncbi:MAG: DUF362 domain-containing protein [Lentisphaerae bacterium]|mgnify:CR=1 FL=1|nr:DUF362 domain-containing protein [Lentisphaerota bacterium]MBT5608115.1 DUF362 domain-containing protein [Lentisphaerota bacterium]MBT7060608.1 DUF362 domain-containing protein [Lentisphaerota bacterium]MBT7847707.1 DUF362 domain-containing protein [Lentisphaerota bacterium]